MSVVDIFSETFATEAEIQQAISRESQIYEFTFPSEDIAYIEDRRRLLGPVADTTHPEFGRANLPEETFSLAYIMTECVDTSLDETTQKPLNRPSIRVVELVFSVDGQLLESQDI